MEFEILILNTELSTKKEDILKHGVREDIDLINEINKFKKELQSKNIEIFEQIKNILITEEGYYLAVYEFDINKIDEEE
jgi:hypothetical protein